MKKDMTNFDSDSLTCDPVLIPVKISPNSETSNRIFPEGKGDKFLILTDLDVPMAEVFP